MIWTVLAVVAAIVLIATGAFAWCFLRALDIEDRRDEA
jgi:hypothetical protein